MRRAEICEKAGISLPTFKKLMRDGDLPWSRISQKQKDAAPELGWGEYGLWELANLIAMKTLRDSSGLSSSEAASILRGGRNYDGEMVEGYDTAGPLTLGDRFDKLDLGEWVKANFHIARVRFLREDGQDPDLTKPFHIYRGKLDEIVKHAGKFPETFNTRFPSVCEGQGRIALVGIVSVDFSHALSQASCLLGQDA